MKTVHYTVAYTFKGFIKPVTDESSSTLNLVHAGDLIKIGFGLNGNRGLNIGTFSSTPVACPSWAPDSIKAAGGGASSGLSFGAGTGHYSYGWQRMAGWASTCRQFSLQLNDGTPPHTAVFMFFS
ncbi:MAG TPA: PxKF domain-containing protein [Gaiellaceae bacterium]|nr:PxKF domain-containing protein [Gaiellaceae bacterium]